MRRFLIQRNPDLANLLVTKNSVKGMCFALDMVKYMEKRPDITKPGYSEHNSPVQ